ncbi:MAG: class I SAM-dependent RNA methyltransferase [Planctomycetes bacterium]|nr:class I SAM-dependent RNA methyltransferase [Planctomycetota bacterium]
MSAEPEFLVARVERLVASGAGLARVDGQVVFVRGALPGDLVRARIVRRARRHLEAETVERIESSPERRAPRCRHFGACGGCALQDLSYPAQLAAKRALLCDALRSIAGIRTEIPLEIIGSPEYGWRARGEFQLAPTADGSRPAAFRPRSSELTPLAECPVLVPELEAELRRRAAGPWTAAPAARVLRLAAGTAGVAAVELDANGALIGAEPEVVQHVAGFALACGAASFFQGNRALLEPLVERATGGARGALAFDLYAGSGLFSLPLSRAFDLVLAAEEDPAAVERSRRNAAANGRTNVRFEAADVARWIVRARRLDPDFVLLDPPRSGPGPGVAEAVAAVARREIRYVSCDPATLARDLRAMLARGWRLESLALLDLFPQTLHVESVARLVPALSPAVGA